MASSPLPSPRSTLGFVPAGARSALPGSAVSDLDACRAQLADGSRTFLAASHLLPRSVRDPATALYAFCRSADDAVDLDERDELAAVERLRDRLARIYAGDPAPVAADRAFARVVAEHAMPRELPEALLDGFDWDARGRRYETLEDLYAYAARVAGTVGAMMTVLMGTRSTEALARACDLGVAMQLSNIARDVGEDARRGRIYLPLRWLREAGIDPDAWLARPVFDPRIGTVVERLLRAADVLYERAGSGIALLPLSCRPGIQAARVLYAAIGHEVGRRGGDSVTQRTVVPGSRKLRLLAGALVSGAWTRRGRGHALPPLDAVRWLVEAAVLHDPTLASTRSAAQPRTDLPPLNAATRVVWVIELCEQQAVRRQGRRGESIAH